MKFLSIFSVAACVFGTLVAASPVAVPAPVDNQLVARTDDSKGKPIIDALIKLEIDIDICNKKWENICKSKKCGQQDVVDFQAELAVIIDLAAKDIKGKIPSGFKFIDVTIVINLLASIIVKVNAGLIVVINLCGLLSGLLISIFVSLSVQLKASLNLLITVLALCVDGLTIKLNVVLSGLLKGVLCLVCGLLNIIL